MTTTTDAIQEIRAFIPEDILHALAEFDGSTTILVPNQSTTYALGELIEVPQIIQFANERLETFPARFRWNLRATSTSIRHTNADTMANRKDWNMVLVGTRECEVNIGGRWFSDAEFFAMMLAAAQPGNDKRSTEQIVAALVQRGLAFKGAMPMYLQHLGADEERFNAEIVPLFQSLGATDNTDNIRQNTQGQGKSQTVKSMRIDGDGARVVNFEVGVADRTRSANGAGFISFLDATYTTVAAIVEADRTLAQANKILNDPNADEMEKGVAANRKAEMVAYWGSGSQRTRRPFHNWGGTTRQQRNDGGVQFYPTSVPCGRLVVADAQGREHFVNVWQRGSTGQATGQPAQTNAEPASFSPVIDTGDATDPF